MDTIIRSVYVNDLTGNDVQLLTRGKAVVRLYKDLLKFNNIIDALGPNGQMVLLFPVASDTSGHWVSIISYPNTKTILHADSYGFSWQQELGYTDNNYVKQNLLGNLYNKAKSDGYNVIYSPYKFQKLANGINTCGRHASIRCRFHYLNIHEYARLMMGQQLSPDWIVTCLSFIAIFDDASDEEQIIRILGNMKK